VWDPENAPGCDPKLSDTSTLDFAFDLANMENSPFRDMGWITKVVTVVAAVSLAYLLYRKQRRSSISDIRGPDDCASFLLGLLTLQYLARLALA
jgi:hypothetical protein